jgi:hypothetical protein
MALNTGVELISIFPCQAVDLLMESPAINAHYDPGVWQEDLVSFELSDILVPTIARQLETSELTGLRNALGVRH